MFTYLARRAFTRTRMGQYVERMRVRGVLTP